MTIKRTRRRTSSCAAGILLLLFLATGALLVFSGIPYLASSAFGPVNENLNPVQRFRASARVLYYRGDLTHAQAGGDRQVFTIEEGDSAVTVAVRLEDTGLLRSADVFLYYLVYTGLDTRLVPGLYELRTGDSPVQLAARLGDAGARQVLFTILPGWRSEEIAAALPASGLDADPRQLMKLIQNPEGLEIPALLQGFGSLEGFMSPGEYYFTRTSSPAQLVEAFARRFVETLPADLEKRLAKENLSLYQGVTLAAIVEREAMLNSEKALIASVFRNRLASSMKLESDPTVQYAIGFVDETKSWWKNPLYLNDLHVPSAYNTYIAPGLPPGPICNPGVDALEAVASPAKSDFYYFRARCDGSGAHNFAATFDEHLLNACP